MELKVRLDEALPLNHRKLDLTASVDNVACETARKTHIQRGVDENLEVYELEHARIEQRKDALQNNNVSAVDGGPLVCAVVRNKRVVRDTDALAKGLRQLLKS